ncbi:hypothetical protein [Salinactinospora qingdaonensis]|uniref:Uncharacterized protein n=1 Tax=Salinactinospora qingdaonensis TaxID=702744 RepID=A0ABP7FJN4_9ACTN
MTGPPAHVATITPRTTRRASPAKSHSLYSRATANARFALEGAMLHTQHYPDRAVPTAAVGPR